VAIELQGGYLFYNMAKRLTDTEIWDKEWFMALTPEIKCLVKLVFDKCDLAGVWHPNWTLANAYVGRKVSEKDLLSVDDGKQFVKIESGKIFCVDFISFQNGNLSDKSPIHIKILNLLHQHSIPYPYPIHRVCNTPVVEVVVGVGVKEEVKVNQKGSLVFPFSSNEFKNIWEVLLKEKKWRNKSPTSLQASLKKLSQYSEQDAIKMIENTIAGEWQGLFELKTNNNGNKQGYNHDTGLEALKILRDKHSNNG